MTGTSSPPPPGFGDVGPVAALTEATRLVDEVAETIWAARKGDELTATVEMVAKLRAKLDGLELAVAHELDAGALGRAAMQEAGWASVKDYLTHANGARKGNGPGTVRLARHLEQLPALREALAAGEISRVKTHIIATSVDRLPLDRRLRAKALAVLLEQASRLSADDLDRAGRHVLEVVDPDGVDARLERELAATDRAAHRNRSLDLRFDRLGGAAGRFHGPAEDALLLKTVLLALAAPRPAEPGACGGDEICTSSECRATGHSGRDPRDHGARMFDALVELARHAQATGRLPESHGGVPQVVVTMDYQDLAARTGHATTTLGEDLDPATVRRLACDADIIPSVLGADGTVLDVGRTQRLVTAAIWTALVVRDRHCAFPGCRRPPIMCHAHHLTHWADGGATTLDNLVMLCGTHHRIIHSTPWQVRLDPSDRRPRFRPPREEQWIRDPAAAPPDDPPDARTTRPAA